MASETNSRDLCDIDRNLLTLHCPLHQDPCHADAGEDYDTRLGAAVGLLLPPPGFTVWWVYTQRTCTLINGYVNSRHPMGSSTEYSVIHGCHIATVIIKVSSVITRLDDPYK